MFLNASRPYLTSHLPSLHLQFYSQPAVSVQPVPPPALPLLQPPQHQCARGSTACANFFLRLSPSLAPYESVIPTHCCHSPLSDRDPLIVSVAQQQALSSPLDAESANLSKKTCSCRLRQSMQQLLARLCDSSSAEGAQPVCRPYRADGKEEDKYADSASIVVSGIGMASPVVCQSEDQTYTSAARVDQGVGVAVKPSCGQIAGCIAPCSLQAVQEGGLPSVSAETRMLAFNELIDIFRTVDKGMFPRLLESLAGGPLTLLDLGKAIAASVSDWQHKCACRGYLCRGKLSGLLHECEGGIEERRDGYNFCS